MYEVLPVQLGELEENQVAPKNLVLFDHTHVPKTVNSTQPGTFITGTSTKLTSADLNPLFSTPAVR